MHAYPKPTLLWHYCNSVMVLCTLHSFPKKTLSEGGQEEGESKSSTLTFPSYSQCDTTIIFGVNSWPRLDVTCQELKGDVLLSTESLSALQHNDAPGWLYVI